MAERINAVQNDPIDNVDLGFFNTKVCSDILRRYLIGVTDSSTVAELHQNVIDSLHRLNSLEVFKTCEVEVDTGGFENSAFVKYNFKDKKWWAISLGFMSDQEGGKTSFSATMRNLRGKADSTKVNVDYKHNTRTYGYELSHHDPFFMMDKLETILSLYTGSEEIDQNILEHSAGLSYTFNDKTGKHKLSLGHVRRKNEIFADKASSRLINEEIAVSGKNFATYVYTKDTRDDPFSARYGYLLELTNEFAFGDVLFDKIGAKFSQYFPVFSGAFQISANLGYMFTGKTRMTDRYRGRFLKGFTSVGQREQPADEKQRGVYHVEGDDMGYTSQLNLEAKLHWYETPILQNMNIFPFVYGNYILLNPTKFDLKQESRGSVGFGLAWAMNIGRIELVYSTRVFTKPGDVPAEFQLLFSA